jgi:hypothetical protein
MDAILEDWRIDLRNGPEHKADDGNGKLMSPMKARVELS